jgi:hypothetical protein
MNHVKVMIFLDCFNHCSKYYQQRPLIYISKRASGSAIVHLWIKSCFTNAK